MTEVQAIRKLRWILNHRDVETGHEEADEVVCALLESLGYTKIAEVYKSIPKWYG